MVSLKGDRFLQFTISSGNEFQSLMVAGKKECMKVSVVQMGNLSDLCEWFPTKLGYHTCYTAEWFVVIKHKSGCYSLHYFYPVYVFLVEGIPNCRRVFQD